MVSIRSPTPPEVRDALALHGILENTELGAGGEPGSSLNNLNLRNPNFSISDHSSSSFHLQSSAQEGLWSMQQ